MSKIKFVGLHAHTTFSVGDAIGFPKGHFDYAIENGMNAMAITEHGNGNSFGYVVQVANEYKSKGVPFKPIFGVEAYYHPDLEEWAKLKEANSVKVDNDLVVENEEESKEKHSDPLRRRHHLVILAQNYQGLQNLFRLVSRSYRDGFYRYPRIDFQMLKEYNEGLIISTACVAGLPGYLSAREFENGTEAIQKAFDDELLPLLELFGKDRAFLELQFNKLEEQRLTNRELIKFSFKNGYKLIASADSHYSRPEFWRERELYKLLAMQSKKWNMDNMALPESVEDLKCELYPKNGEQMFAAYKKMYDGGSERLDEIIKEAIERTYDIAHEQIKEIELDQSMKLPVLFDSPFKVLKDLCIDAMKKRGFDRDEIYVSRLASELKVIREKNFAPYFLTLYQAMNVLRKHMLVGPARGSAAGALTCYLLKITQLDPVKNGLLFERFLAEHREEAPDIDVDLEDKELCLEILKEEFGEDNVIPVTNFNTLQLKSLVKDISKLYGIPYMEANDVTTRMEDEARRSILDKIGGDQKFYSFDFENAKEFSPTFRKFLEKYPKVGEHIEILFGQNKSLGRHAGGVVICEEAESCMPVIRIRGQDQTPFSEGLAARHLEQFGLIKYDFLGLTTLRIIRRCIELVLRNQGISNPTIEDVYEFYNTHLHPDVLDKSDPQVFKHVYQQGRFPGIFQFAEPAVQNFCKRAKPENINDISNITSLFRPGPLAGQADKEYIKARHGEKIVEFDHAALKEVLNETYGQLVYQEQFMLLANELAGFSLSEADKLRKLLMKPITSLAEEMKKARKQAGKKFIEGCVKNELTEDRAKKLWKEEILGFISYGFNKSHSMAYSYISLQCAYLYTYHEKEWVRSYLENDSNRDKAISDVESVGYKVGKLDINRSGLDWEIEGNVIYPSLMTVKGIGDIATNEVVNQRNECGGSFESLDQLFYKEGFTPKTRKPKKVWRFSKFNKKAISALIQVEAFDSMNLIGPGNLFENYRHMHSVLIENYDKLKRGSLDVKTVAISSTDSEKTPWTDMEKVDIQKELLGTYDKSLLFSKKVLEAFKKYDIAPLADLDYEPRYIWFILKDFSKKETKTGKPYFKLKITDIDNQGRTLNFFRIYNDDGSMLSFSRNAIYVGTLFNKDGWINAVYGSKLIKIS